MPHRVVLPEVQENKRHKKVTKNKKRHIYLKCMQKKIPNQKM